MTQKTEFTQPHFCRIEVQPHLGGGWKQDHGGVRLVDPAKYAETCRRRNNLAGVRVVSLDDATVWEALHPATKSCEDLV